MSKRQKRRSIDELSSALHGAQTTTEDAQENTMDHLNNNDHKDADRQGGLSEPDDSSGDEDEEFPYNEYDHEVGQLSDAEWTIRHTDYLLDRVEVLRKAKELDWQGLAGELQSKFGISRSPEDCRLWFYFLYDKFRRVPNQKRHRRRAWEIVRKWFCYVEGCSKGYGTERSLRQHFAQKHKGVLYSKATADQFSSTAIRKSKPDKRAREGDSGNESSSTSTPRSKRSVASSPAMFAAHGAADEELNGAGVPKWDPAPTTPAGRGSNKPIPSPPAFMRLEGSAGRPSPHPQQYSVPLASLLYPPDHQPSQGVSADGADNQTSNELARQPLLPPSLPHAQPHLPPPPPMMYTPYGGYYPSPYMHGAPFGPFGGPMNGHLQDAGPPTVGTFHGMIHGGHHGGSPPNNSSADQQPSANSPPTLLQQPGAPPNGNWNEKMWY